MRDKRVRWTADEITFIYICLKLGVPLKKLAEHLHTSTGNLHDVAKRNGMGSNKLRLTPEEVRVLWDNGCLRFLF